MKNLKNQIIALFFCIISSNLAFGQKIEKEYYCHFLIPNAKYSKSFENGMTLIANYALAQEGFSINTSWLSSFSTKMTSSINDFIYGGTPVAGKLTITKSHVIFKPFEVQNLILENIEEIKIPRKEIKKCFAKDKSLTNPYGKFEILTQKGTFLGQSLSKSFLELTLSGGAGTLKEFIAIMN